MLRTLELVAEVSHWSVDGVESGWEALERVQSALSPDLVILDLARGDADGLHTLRWLRRLRPELPVVMFASPEESTREIEAARLGAQDFLVKPLERHQLQSLLQRHLTQNSQVVRDQFAAYQEPVDQRPGGQGLITASPQMRKLRDQAKLLSQINVPVLITGESGTGKDDVARLVHELSDRSASKFLKVTCGAFEGELLETELFGEENGPKANRTRAGQLELCHKGTLLLDEITDIPLNLQAKLLRVMQNGKLFRVNGANPVKVDVRVLATTNADINQALAAKRIRDDFYYHLSAFMMHVPALRQRKDDIPMLLESVMQRISRQYGLPARKFSAAALQSVLNYSWPGNLRELEKFVKRYLLAGEGDWISDEFRGPALTGAHTSDLAETQPDRFLSAPENDGGLKSLIRSLRGEAERNAIAGALDQTRWNRKAAARLLQVSYRTLLYKIEHYHMSPPAHLAPMVGGNCQKLSGH